MPGKSRTCLDCKLSSWKKTTNGRLHPDKTGRCIWQMPKIMLPLSRYYVGSDRREVYAPVGGFILRDKPYENCPAWEADDAR